MKKSLVLLFSTLLLVVNGFGQDFDLDVPEIILEESTVKVYVHFESEISDSTLLINGAPTALLKDETGNYFYHTFTEGNETILARHKGYEHSLSTNPISGWWSILPPLLAIVLALITKEVLSSLFIGVFCGAAIIGVASKGFLIGVSTGFLAVIDTYILNALNSSDHLSIILFSMVIGSIVTIISKNGGMLGIVNAISKYAKDAFSGQLATYFMGIAIFFDDYANTLVVGNTMRPVTDRLKISREKLAYIVDSTAAPIASIAFVTTWIGAELSYIADGTAVIPQITEGAYSILINSLQFSFYPIFTLIFILFLIFQRKDFGTMLHAEKLARAGKASPGLPQTKNSKSGEQALEEFEMKEGLAPNPWLAIIPIAVIILGTISGLLVTGWNAETWNEPALGFGKKMSIIIGNSNSYIALLWSSLTGLAVAIILSISTRSLTISESVESMMSGFKTMLTAILILTLAWSLAGVTEHLETANFLKTLWSDGMTPVLIPLITFVLSALVSFSTGSSWGTMAILYPILLPATYEISVAGGLDHPEAMMIFYNVVSTVLAGSVLGDHCSPISDTTILSSLASGCNHIEHVRTQMPYALTVGAVSILVGTLPAALGISTWLLYPVGVGLLFLIVKYFGKLTD